MVGVMQTNVMGCHRLGLGEEPTTVAFTFDPHATGFALNDLQNLIENKCVECGLLVAATGNGCTSYME